MNTNSNQFEVYRSSADADIQDDKVSLDELRSQIIQDWKTQRGHLDDESIAAHMDRQLRFLKFCRVSWHLRRCPICQHEVNAFAAALEIEPPPGLGEYARSIIAKWLHSLRPHTPVRALALAGAGMLLLIGLPIGERAVYLAGERAGTQKASSEIALISNDPLYKGGTIISPFSPLTYEGLLDRSIPSPTSKERIERAILTLERYTEERGPEEDVGKYLDLLLYYTDYRKFVTSVAERQKLEAKITTTKQEVIGQRPEWSAFVASIAGDSTHENPTKDH